MTRDTGGGVSLTTTTPTDESPVALSMLAGETYTVSASLDPHFPPGLTRSVTFTAGQEYDPAVVRREETVHVAPGGGVVLRGCARAEGVRIRTVNPAGGVLA